MSGKAKTLSIVAIGILLAASVIAGVSFLQKEGLLPEISSSSGAPESSTITGASSTSSVQSSSRGSSSSSSGTQTAGGLGSLVLQIHDPPHVPQGVTAVFVRYSNIWLGNSSNPELLALNQTGSIDLMTVVNFTQTIAHLQIPEGTFNVLLMNISVVTVTLNSVNYSAFLPNNRLTVPIAGGLQISHSATVGAVIDVSPTLIEHTAYSANGTALISFVLVPSANAYIIPADQMTPARTQVGDREDARQQNWLTNDIGNTQNNTSFILVSSVLSNHSFFLSVKNTGNTTISIQSVFISAGNYSQPPQAGGEDRGDEYNLGRAVVFGVLANGSLTPFSAFDSESDYGPTGVGYTLAAHSTATLSYWGPIPPAASQSSTGEGSGGGGAEDSSSTTTISYSSSSGSGGELPSNAPYNSADQTATTFSSTLGGGELTTQSSSGYYPQSLQIVSGQKYTVGATCGGATATLVVVAS